MDHVAQVLDLTEEERVDSDIVEEAAELLSVADIKTTIIMYLRSEHEREVVDDIPVGLEVDLPTAVVEDMAEVQEDTGLVYLDLAAADTSSCRRREEHRVVVQTVIVAHIPSSPAVEDKVDDYGLPFMQS